MQILLDKLDYDSKINREKRDNERRKNLLILILRYLINMGFSETAFNLQEEAKLDIDKYEVADNVDLNIILSEYEEYFEIKFNKKPVLVKKMTEENNPNKLPNIRNNRDPRNIKGRETPKTLDNKDKLKNAANNKLNEKNEKQQGNNIINDLKLELVGQNMNIKKDKEKEEKEKEKFSFNDQKESILLKPFPDNLFGNNELRELAGMVKK
jgi:katanin p60 ATPase-containing subunit A1